MSLWEGTDQWPLTEEVDKKVAVWEAVGRVQGERNSVWVELWVRELVREHSNSVAHVREGVPQWVDGREAAVG